MFVQNKTPVFDNGKTIPIGIPIIANYILDVLTKTGKGRMEFNIRYKNYAQFEKLRDFGGKKLIRSLLKLCISSKWTIQTSPYILKSFIENDDNIVVRLDLTNLDTSTLVFDQKQCEYISLTRVEIKRVEREQQQLRFY